MEDYIMTIMKRASIFMILSQALIHFRPNPSYEKYFKFLAGIMTVVIFVIPFMELLRSGMMEKYQACVDEYTAYLEEVSSRQLTVEMTPSQSYLRMMEEEIKKKLNNDTIIEGYEAKRVELLGISGDGEIAEEDCRIKIYVSSIDTEISPIRIDKIGLQDDNGRQENAGGSGAGKEFTQRAAQILGMEEDRVEVVIDE